MKNSKAFTMAEILISLTIIGVIAAITLPSLRANINEKTWATQKKALFSRMTQGIAMLDAVNDYDNAQEFITSGLSEVLKINNICDGANLKDCGINEAQLITMNGNTASFPKLWQNLGISKNWNASEGDNESAISNKNTAMVGAFETQNGESIVVYYNPECVPDNDEMPTSVNQEFEQFKYTCANMVYDLNQDKGPNTVGKDIGFMTVFYASDPVVVSPIPAGANSELCSDTERIPTINEATSLMLNSNMIGGLPASVNTSSRAINGNTTYYFQVAAISSNDIKAKALTSAPTGSSRCIKR